MKSRKVILPFSEDEILKIQLKRKLEASLFGFVQWVFEYIYKKPFEVNWHHKVICETLEKIHRGELQHTIFNFPPRYTKTEIVVKIFPAWSYAKNALCNFLHLSYSDELALDNSSAVKTIIESEEFQALWPIPLRTDTTAKKKWKTQEGGEFGARAAGGQVTGFGAGVLGAKEFSGAILIDDPIKPDDASSDTVRNSINNRFPNTIKSRLNDRSTPLILIMQRLHEDDPTGFLLGGGTELEFTHVNLPAVNEDGPNEFDPREVGEALWIFKHTEEELEKMRLSSAMTYAGQYQQRPAPKEGNIFKEAYVQYYTELPFDLFHFTNSWDLTFKKESKNKRNKTDFVVGTAWAKRRTNADIYLLPYMQRARMDFDDTLTSVKFLREMDEDVKAILIEDKANGPAIISRLRKEGVKRVIEVEPQGDKEERLQAVIPLYKSKTIWYPHPSIAPWIEDFINEHKVFPNGKHDDQVDSGTQAVEYLEKISTGGISGSGSQTDTKEKSEKGYQSKLKSRGRNRIKPKTY